jgi:hypothetical protein
MGQSMKKEKDRLIRQVFMLQSPLLRLDHPQHCLVLRKEISLRKFEYEKRINSEVY